jgi:hypothetical protein
MYRIEKIVIAVNMEGRMSSRHFSRNIWRVSHFDGVLEPIFLLKYVFLQASEV